MHPAVEQRELEEPHRRDRDPHRFLAGGVDLGLETGQVEGEQPQRRHRFGGRSVREAEGDDGVLVDGVGLERVGDLEERRGQQLLGDHQLADVAELGTDGDTDLVGGGEELGDLAAGVGAGRADPGVHGDLGVGDGLGEGDQFVVVEHAAGRVDLQDQAADAVAFGSFDRFLDEVGDDAVDEARHLHHVEEGRVERRGVVLGTRSAGHGGGQDREDESDEGHR